MPESAWPPGRLLEWFREYHATPEARDRSRSTAARRGISELADDLHHEWYLSITTTVGRMRRADDALPDWLDSEEAATRYVLRALANDAVDLGRQRDRAPTPELFLSLPEGDDGILERWARTDEGLDRVDVNGVLRAMTRDLNRLLRGRAGGCPGCSSELTVRICLGVVARLRDPLEQERTELVRGGTDQWDKLIYEVMSQVAPERLGTTAEGHMDDRARQAKSRCSRCARRLLGELLALHLGGDGG